MQSFDQDVFASPDFDVKAWVNQTLGQELPPNTEIDVCDRIADAVTFLNM